jgi:Protein of unknown function (DUF1018)
MGMTGATRDQLAAIHVLAKQAGMDEDTRRDFMQRETGHRSARDMSIAAAGRVIEKLREVTGQGATLPRGAVAGLGTPLGGKLRALWIAGYNLALVRDRSDRAMLAFVERQTGVSHTRFFTDPSQGTAAVEGLKGWLARNGVSWPNEKDDVDALASRRAIIDAQWLKLVSHDPKLVWSSNDPMGDLLPFARRVTGMIGHPDWDAFLPSDLDQVQAALGRRLRAQHAGRRRHDAEAAA